MEAKGQTRAKAVEVPAENAAQDLKAAVPAIAPETHVVADWGPLGLLPILQVT